MKTTLEIPDAIFRRAKSVAAQRGIPLRAFVTEAAQEKLEAGLKREEKPWVRLVEVSSISTKKRCVSIGSSRVSSRRLSPRIGDPIRFSIWTCNIAVQTDGHPVLDLPA